MQMLKMPGKNTPPPKTNKLFFNCKWRPYCRWLKIHHLKSFNFFNCCYLANAEMPQAIFLTQVAIQTKEPLSQTARKGCVCMLIIWWCIVGKGANESFCFEGNKSSYCSARCMSERVLWLSVCVCMKAIFNPNVLGICFLRVCVCVCVCVCVHEGNL